MTWHNTSDPIASNDVTITWPDPQTSRHQNTSLQSTRHHHHGTAEGSFTAKKWFGHRAGRSPCAHSIGKFFLCYIVLFLLETSAPGLSGHYWYIYIYIYIIGRNLEMMNHLQWFWWMTFLLGFGPYIFLVSETYQLAMRIWYRKHPMIYRRRWKDTWSRSKLKTLVVHLKQGYYLITTWVIQEKHQQDDDDDDDQRCFSWNSSHDFIWNVRCLFWHSLATECPEHVIFYPIGFMWLVVWSWYILPTFYVDLYGTCRYTSPMDAIAIFCEKTTR